MPACYFLRGQKEVICVSLNCAPGGLYARNDGGSHECYWQEGGRTLGNRCGHGKEGAPTFAGGVRTYNRLWLAMLRLLVS